MDQSMQGIVTSGAEWRRKIEEGIVVELPSGNCARLRSISFESLWQAGKIPDTLTTIIAEYIEGKPQDMPGTQQLIEAFKDQIVFMQIVAREMFISPRIVDDPRGEDEIGFEHLEIGDLYFVYKFLNRSIRDLESFRPQQKSDVEPVEDEPEPEPATEPDHPPGRNRRAKVRSG